MKNLHTKNYIFSAAAILLAGSAVISPLFTTNASALSRLKFENFELDSKDVVESSVSGRTLDPFFTFPGFIINPDGTGSMNLRSVSSRNDYDYFVARIHPDGRKDVYELTGEKINEIKKDGVSILSLPAASETKGFYLTYKNGYNLNIEDRETGEVETVPVPVAEKFEGSISTYYLDGSVYFGTAGRSHNTAKNDNFTFRYDLKTKKLSDPFEHFVRSDDAFPRGRYFVRDNVLYSVWCDNSVESGVTKLVAVSLSDYSKVASVDVADDIGMMAVAQTEAGFEMGSFLYGGGPNELALYELKLANAKNFETKKLEIRKILDFDKGIFDELATKEGVVCNPIAGSRVNEKYAILTSFCPAGGTKTDNHIHIFDANTGKYIKSEKINETRADGKHASYLMGFHRLANGKAYAIAMGNIRTEDNSAYGTISAHLVTSFMGEELGEKSEAESEVKPEAKPETKPSEKPETKPEIKPSEKPATKPEKKPLPEKVDKNPDTADNLGQTLAIASAAGAVIFFILKKFGARR